MPVASMQPETIHELYLYNHWANQRALASVAPLSPEQFTRSMGNSFGSVRDTLAHILGAEWILAGALAWTLAQIAASRL